MSVHIEKRGTRIVLSSPSPITGMKSAIPGAYQSVSGAWTVPLSIETCRLLKQKFGRSLRVGDQLRRWAAGELENRRYMSKLAASEDAELENLPHVAPKLAKAMGKRKYQRVGARFIADNPATLLADDPGLGKTLIAMGGIIESGVPGPYLIVAPKTAAESVWRREISRWLGKEHRAVTLPQFRHQREKKLRLTRYTPTTWLIVHPEVVLVASWWVCGECGERTPEGSKQQRELKCGHMRDDTTETLREPSYPRLFDVEWGAIVVDESHESLIRRKGVPTQRRRGLDSLKLRADGLRIAASGTPFESKPQQLWGTLNWLDRQTYSAYHRWAEMFWQKGGRTGYEIGEFIKEREPLLWDSISAIALRRTKAEVAKDLPPKTYVGTPLTDEPTSPVGVWLEMDGKQAQAYEAMEQTSVAQLDSGRLSARTALAELTRLKQLACAYGEVTAEVRGDQVHYAYRPSLPSNKFDWTVEALEEWGYPHNPITKVVIVSFYTSILEVFGAGIEKHFRTKPNRPLCTYITGRTPSNKRRAIIDRFNQTDPHSPQIIFLNIKAGGTAITLDTADRMIFVSETRIPDQQIQAEDRIHRVSNPRTCMYYYLRTLGTVDVGTALTNQVLHADSHRLLDGRRGIDYVRNVLSLSAER